MELRCQDGDLAVIVKDDPRLFENVGRVVIIRGPLEIDSRRGPLWYAQPVDGRAMRMVNCFGCIEQDYRFFGGWADYPDNWLLPIGRAADAGCIATEFVVTKVDGDENE